MHPISRRTFLRGIGLSGVGVVAAGYASSGEAKTVTAVEDLMREHGVLRRALLVYAETVPKLRQEATPAMAHELRKTAELFRTFGEDYHEKKLEEAHIFPMLEKQGESLASLVAILIAQHQRGRQITDYILALTQEGRIAPAGAAELATVLEAFILMYQNHAAREDTVIFPAWKRVLTDNMLADMGAKFEDIEHAQFGDDGFEKAVGRIAEIEHNLGLADIAQFTPQPPPGL